MLEQTRRRELGPPDPSSERAGRFAHYPHFRYNYLLGILNGVVFNNGMSFFNRTTIIPVFMRTLGAPGILISLASLFEVIGWHLPQFFASKFVVHKPLKLPLYRTAAILRVSGLLVVVASAWLSGVADHGWALALFVLGFGLFGVASGFAGLVFTEVMAKTTPKEKRGSYFGWRAIISGVTGFFLGIWVIKPIFALNDDPINYIISFGAGTSLIALSFYLFLQQREPEQTNLPPVRTLRVQLTKARRILLVDRRFRRMVIFRAALMIWFAGIPYYVLFATEQLAYSKGSVGLFTSWEFAGAIIANPLWGYLSNRIGNKTLLVVICVLAVMVSVAMLLFIVGVLPASLFGLIFLASAAVDSGAGTGGINYALEIVPEGERPTYIGLMNSLLAAALLLATVGGVLHDLVGYEGLYIFTGCIAVGAFLLIVRLPEPRKAEVA